MGYFPSIDERLVTVLGEKFPDQCPELGMSDQEIWFKAGQASVARWLKSQYEQQQDDAFTLEDN